MKFGTDIQGLQGVNPEDCGQRFHLNNEDIFGSQTIYHNEFSDRLPLISHHQQAEFFVCIIIDNYWIDCSQHDKPFWFKLPKTFTVDKMHGLSRLISNHICAGAKYSILQGEY